VRLEEERRRVNAEGCVGYVEEGGVSDVSFMNDSFILNESLI